MQLDINIQNSVEDQNLRRFAFLSLSFSETLVYRVVCKWYELQLATSFEFLWEPGHDSIFRSVLSTGAWSFAQHAWYFGEESKINAEKNYALDVDLRD